MKKIVVFTLVALLPFIGFSQSPWDPVQFNQNGKVEFIEILDFPGSSKNEIFSSVQNWFLDNYKNPKEVIQFEDLPSGIISGNAIVPFYAKTLGQTNEHLVKYTIKIEVKDEKARLSLSNYFILNPQFGESAIENQFTNASIKKNGEIRDFPLAIKNQLVEHFDLTKLSLTKKILSSKTDDW